MRHGGNACAQALRGLLPQACALCAAACGDALLCPPCGAALPRVHHACPVCALPALHDVPCGACLAHPPPYSSTVAAWAYAFPLDRLVQGLKYGAQLALAEPLAAGLVDAIRRRFDADDLPDAVVALPLAAARQRSRGFNQAAELARRIAAATGRPLVPGLVRPRDSPPQVSLAWSDRARNVRNAFVGTPALAGLRIAIVDDVMTTGATLAAAARAARRAGARDVAAWVVARTPPPAA